MAYFFKHERGLTFRLKTVKLPDGAPTMVLYELLTYWSRDKNNDIYPSIETIMSQTGYSRSTVQRAFRSIVKCGLLKSVGGGRGYTPNTWVVTDSMKTLLSEEKPLEVSYATRN